MADIIAEQHAEYRDTLNPILYRRDRLLRHKTRLENPGLCTMLHRATNLSYAKRYDHLVYTIEGKLAEVEKELQASRSELDARWAIPTARLIAECYGRSYGKIKI